MSHVRLNTHPHNTFSINIQLIHDITSFMAMVIGFQKYYHQIYQANTLIIHKNIKIYVENYFSIERKIKEQTLNLSTIIKSITISSQVYILEIHTNYSNISL